MKRLEGKAALVTGAGSRSGIGCACALRLAREGAAVAVADLGSLRGGPAGAEAGAALQEIAAELAALGVPSLSLEMDVTGESSVETGVRTVREAFGRIDILFNNAGTVLAPAPLTQTGLDAWEQTLRVNLTGTLLVSRAVVPLMMEQGGGSIINMSSRAARTGAVWMHAYSAAKAGILGLTRSMALELAPYRIRVNAVCPGDIDTALKRWGFAKEALVKGKTAEEIAAEAARFTPLGRVGLPEDVAAAVAFFASADSDYLTGEILNITGGQGVRPVLPE